MEKLDKCLYRENLLRNDVKNVFKKIQIPRKLGLLSLLDLRKF